MPLGYWTATRCLVQVGEGTITLRSHLLWIRACSSDICSGRAAAVSRAKEHWRGTDSGRGAEAEALCYLEYLEEACIQGAEEDRKGAAWGCTEQTTQNSDAAGYRMHCNPCAVHISVTISRLRARKERGIIFFGFAYTFLPHSKPLILARLIQNILSKVSVLFSRQNPADPSAAACGR